MTANRAQTEIYFAGEAMGLTPATRFFYLTTPAN
jgi:hypothetical protein